MRHRFGFSLEDKRGPSVRIVSGHESFHCLSISKSLPHRPFDFTPRRSYNTLIMADEDGYAGALAAQLMEALGAGASDLSALATRLNETGPAPSVGAWTPDLLAAELARIAIVPPKAVVSPSVVPIYDAERARRYPFGPTSPALDVEARTEFLLTYGLRNQWYVVAASAEIGETPVGLQRLGEKLVLMAR